MQHNIPSVRPTSNRIPVAIGLSVVFFALSLFAFYDPGGTAGQSPMTVATAGPQLR